MVRRRQPRRTYRDVRLYAAHRKVGHELAWWYVFWEPLLRRLGPPAAAVTLLMVLWFKVPHYVLGIGALAVAGATLALWAAYSASDRNLQARMNGAPRGTGLGWAVGTVSAALVAVGWAALWGPGSQ